MRLVCGIAGNPGGTRPDGRLPGLISVIVPVLNAENHIGEQLAALASQTYRGPWEVVVVNNGCTDGSIAIARALGESLPWLTVTDATARRGLNHARNVGVSAARGDFVVFCDADDAVTPGWLEAMANAARRAEIVGGTADYEALNDRLARSWEPWDPPSDLPSDNDFLPYVSGGNCGMWTSIAREIGWDESFTFGSSDIEFAWRAQLASYRLSFVPEAVIRQRLNGLLRGLARRYYAYGKSDPQLYRRFRRLGMPRPGARQAIKQWRRLLTRCPDLLRSAESRGRWVRIAARRCGRVVGSIRFRVVVL